MRLQPLCEAFLILKDFLANLSKRPGPRGKRKIVYIATVTAGHLQGPLAELSMEPVSRIKEVSSGWLLFYKKSKEHNGLTWIL